MAAPLSSCLYQSRVMHHRLRPVAHRFTYRVFSLFLDLDEDHAVDGRLRLLSVERRNLLSFHAIDHGPRDGSPLKPWVLARLAERGIKLDQPKISLLCFPRLLGFVFNPLSIYYCYEGQSLRALVYEVKNTFGGQHTYVFKVQVTADGRHITTHGCAKEFFVSPFIDMTARYEFRLAPPGERLAIVIRESEAGLPLLVATQTGERRPLTDHSILACLASNLLMTFKVVFGIHLEALRLWLKGAPLFLKSREVARAGPGRIA